MSLLPQRESARHRHPSGVGDAKPPSSYPQRRCGIRCTAGQPDFRRRARRPVDHYIRECNPGAEPRAERLQDRLLGGETPGQALNPIGPISNLVKFGLDETAWNQRVARIVDPSPQLGDDYQVNAMSDHVQRNGHSLYPRQQSLR